MFTVRTFGNGMETIRLLRAKYLHRRPQEREMRLLRSKLASLMDPELRIAWHKLEKGRPDTLPIIALRFRGCVELDELFCAFFWGRVIPSSGAGWIIRAHAFDPDRRTVFAEPLSDGLNLLCANIWHDGDGYNPLVSACLGFKYLFPFRDIEFPTQ